jgi:RHS repeat-associated protein
MLTMLLPPAMTQSAPCCLSVAFRNGHKFTGKERDAESGLDDFGARYYGSSMGRFMSTDPYIPQFECKNTSCFTNYFGNPKNWNRYAYTRNNPLAFVDPNGEMTELAVGENTADNPFGHVSLIINDKVYSYGTNYNNGADRDWGADANFTSTRKAARVKRICSNST